MIRWLLVRYLETVVEADTEDEAVLLGEGSEDWEETALEAYPYDGPPYEGREVETVELPT